MQHKDKELKQIKDEIKTLANSVQRNNEFVNDAFDYVTSTLEELYDEF